MDKTKQKNEVVISSLIATIENREAIPIRTIPYIAGWERVSPDLLAKELARVVDAPFAFLNDVFSYKVQFERLVQMSPEEDWLWIILPGINALEDEIHAKFRKKTGNHSLQKYAAWQKKSVSRLPAGAFLWRDEFEKRFNKRIKTRYSDQEKHNNEVALKYMPWLPDEVLNIVLDGFRQEWFKHLGKFRTSLNKKIKTRCSKQDKHDGELALNFILILPDKVRDIKREEFREESLKHLEKLEHKNTELKQPEPELKKKGHRETQVAAIVQQAKTFKYNLLSIPYGGKAKIRDECLKDMKLFTKSGFGHAWKKAKEMKLIEVENVESYRAKPA